MVVMVHKANGKKFNRNNLGEFDAKSYSTNSSELPLLKKLPLAFHHSHFLAVTLDFTIFSWGLHTFFTAGLDYQ